VPSNRIIFFDTTLRDGEACLGPGFDLQARVELAHLLAEMKVDVIEAGYPGATEQGFDGVRAVGKSVRGVTIAALCRSSRPDIELTARALEGASKPRIHTYYPTSGSRPEEIIEKSAQAVTWARTFIDDVEFSPMDASRTRPEFLVQVVEAAIQAGAATVSIPDTASSAGPEEFAGLIRRLKDQVPGIERTVLSVHCHDERDLAVENSLAAVSAGARQIECTINGIGERAGNASLEPLVRALRSRPEFSGFYTGVDLSRFPAIQAKVAALPSS